VQFRKKGEKEAQDLLNFEETKLVAQKMLVR
jgi:hypothetical protein